MYPSDTKTEGFIGFKEGMSCLKNCAPTKTPMVIAIQM